MEELKEVLVVGRDTPHEDGAAEPAAAESQITVVTAQKVCIRILAS